MNLAPFIVLGGVVGAVVLSSRRKPKRKSKKRSPEVVLTEPILDEQVPAPADADVVLLGSQDAPNIDGQPVDWWVSEHGGAFGWQYVVTTDGSSEMSYLDGIIYHYSSFESALDDLQQVLG